MNVHWLLRSGPVTCIYLGIVLEWIRSNIRADSWLAPSQWKTPLQSNAVSHWLGANLKSTLGVLSVRIQLFRSNSNVTKPFNYPLSQFSRNLLKRCIPHVRLYFVMTKLFTVIWFMLSNFTTLQPGYFDSHCSVSRYGMTNALFLDMHIKEHIPRIMHALINVPFFS